MFRVISLVLLSACFVAASEGQTVLPTQCGDKTATILILGTFHMDNPRLDSTNIEADDVLSAQRQREITELVEKLASFKPTRIAIEAPYGSTVWPERYTRFLAGKYELKRNEIEQIGFQLAKKLNLPKIYPIDFPLYMSGLRPDEVEEPRPQPSQTTVAKPATPTAPPALSEEDKLLRRSTVTEFLRYLNDEKRIQSDHAQYMQMLLPNDNPAIYARADLVTNWYKRNLRIWSNLNRITEFPRDRVLLIIGSGHLKILKGFATDSPYFCLADTKTYLK
jgi:hypothetical protein